MYKRNIYLYINMMSIYVGVCVCGCMVNDGKKAGAECLSGCWRRMTWGVMLCLHQMNYEVSDAEDKEWFA